MLDRKKNGELQSRREFFKSAAKAALPVLGAVVLSSMPMIKVEAATGCNSACQGACVNTCYGGCNGGCGGTCAGKCLGKCDGLCMSSCYKGASR